MTPIGLLSTTGTLWVMLLCVLVCNFANLFKNAASGDITAEGFGKAGAFHIILGGALALDTLAFIGGLIWLIFTKVGG